MIEGFHHTNIKVVDYDACIDFYTQFGFTITRSWRDKPQRGAMLNPGGGNSYLEVFEGGDPEAPSEGRVTHLAFRTTDCDASHALALKLGAKEWMAPNDRTIPSHQGDLPIRISFVVSPTGEVIEFFQNELT